MPAKYICPCSPLPCTRPAHVLIGVMAEYVSIVAESVGSSTSGYDRKILQAILALPGHSASARQLQESLGLPSTVQTIVQAYAAMDRFGMNVFHALGLHVDSCRKGKVQWWTVVATGGVHQAHGFVWTLRGPIAAGLSAAGYDVERGATSGGRKPAPSAVGNDGQAAAGVGHGIPGGNFHRPQARIVPNTLEDVWQRLRQDMQAAKAERR